MPGLPYIPQYITEPTPPGFRDEEFEYYFDSNNTPGLAALSTPGQTANKITLQLQQDAEFIWHALEISSLRYLRELPANTGPLCVRFYDPFGNELTSVQVEVDRAFGATLNTAFPIGRLPVVFEPPIRCPAGGFLQIDLLLL